MRKIVLYKILITIFKLFILRNLWVPNLAVNFHNLPDDCIASNESLEKSNEMVLISVVLVRHFVVQIFQ